MRVDRGFERVLALTGTASGGEKARPERSLDPLIVFGKAVDDDHGPVRVHRPLIATGAATRGLPQYRS